MIKEKENKFENLLIKLLKHKKIIIINVTILTLAAVIVSLLLPNKYEAQASFIAPKKKGLFGDVAGFSSTISNLSRVLGGRLGNVSEEAYNYLVILQSRTVAEKVIDKFNLREVYDFDPDDPIEDVLKELDYYVDFNIEDEGNVVVSVVDKSPKRAADIANYFVELVNELSIEFSIREAKNNREFIEKRFLEIKKDIYLIEDSLKSFSEKYNVLEIKEQVKSAIGFAAELKAQTEMAKIERDLLKNNYGADHPAVKNADMKIAELNKRLAILEKGENKKLESSVNFFIPFQQVPETGIEYIRLMKEYEIQSKLLEFIYPLYEQAKIEEQKNIPVVLVVDEAKPPQKKTSPKRSLIVIATFIFSFFAVSIYALLKESFLEIQKDEERYKKIQEGIINQINIFSKSKKNDNTQ